MIVFLLAIAVVTWLGFLDDYARDKALRDRDGDPYWYWED
jgi:hypothetical protein